MFDRRVDGQMMMISAALCRSAEKLPNDMSFVLVKDPMEAVILVAVIELLEVKIQPWHL